MLNLTLLQQMLVVAIALSVVTCAFIQKTKKFFPCSSCLVIYSFVVNFVVGILFCMTFTEVGFPNSLWVAFFSFIGADTLYKSLEGKETSVTSIEGREAAIEVIKKDLKAYNDYMEGRFKAYEPIEFDDFLDERQAKRVK